MPIARRTTALLCLLGCVLLPPAFGQREAGVDPHTHPGDDFFQYANGAWLAATPIPPGQPRWGARSEIAARTARQVAELLDDARAAPAGSPARQVADFRAAYLDEAAIEAHGLAPVAPLLQSIDRLRDKVELARWLGRELPADVDPVNTGVFDSAHVLGLALQSGLHGETVYVAYLVQGGLGTGPREAYLSDDAPSRDLRARRQAAVARTLGGLGVPAREAAERAVAVLSLEAALARSHARPEESARETNADTSWSQADFAREAPGMDWAAFFEAAGLARQPSLVPWQPAAVKGLARLVGDQPLSAWQDYLRVRTVERFADVLPRSLSAEPLPGERRSQRALEATQQAMQDDIGRLYVARHFPADRKARVQAIAGRVVTALARRMETAPWLSPTARATAQAKLKALYFGIGYPDRWPDDAALAVAADDPAGNLQRVARRDRERALARIGQAVDRRHWAIAPQWPGAVLTFNENSYNFAAALLQAPKFDPEASEAANYGAIGAIVGHEASHFVDTLGADYEADGRRHRWWSAADLARYAAVTDPLERQFSAYRPFEGVAVDGRRGLVENFADLVGLTAAFDAHRLALGAQAHDAEFVRQRDREFFIGFARSWRIRYRDDALRTQALSDHAPEVYRVWTVRNLDAWYQAFDVHPGHRLYLPPATRVKPWGEAVSPPP